MTKKLLKGKEEDTKLCCSVASFRLSVVVERGSGTLVTLLLLLHWN